MGLRAMKLPQQSLGQPDAIMVLKQPPARHPMSTDDIERPPRRGTGLLALATPLVLLWMLHARALESWWIRDDPCHLAAILDHGLWRPFVQPIGFFLTPWLNLSLGLDLTLFGLAPEAFYAHQLASFSLLILVGYGFLRAWLTPAFAGLALALFVASPAAFAVTQQLMNRHYLEGLILLLASFSLYRRATVSQAWPPALLGAALYLLATATKEVFVPAVLLLPFLACGELRGRLRRAAPYGVALAVYGIWRLAMLGWSNSISAYGSSVGPPPPAALLEGLRALLGVPKPWQALLAAALLAAAALTLGRRSKAALGGLAVGVLVLAVPLVPVLTRLAPRHFFLASFAAAAVLAAALQPPASETGRWRRARAACATILLLLTLGSLSVSWTWRSLDAAVAHHRGEGRFVLESPENGLLLTTLQDSRYLECLSRLRREVLEDPGGPGFCGDPCYCSEAFPDAAIWRVAEDRPRRVDSAPEPGCDARREVAVAMTHDRQRGRLSWRFGPWQEGRYEALLISGEAPPGVSIPVAVPRQGSMPYWLFEPLRLVVKYRSPEGWQTYSAVLTVEPDGHVETSR